MKRKRIGCCMENRRFGPADCVPSMMLPMPIEAFEVFRLIDYVGMDQTGAAAQMGVSRSTVQKLYKEARTMLAKAFVEDAHIMIQGGDLTMTTCRERHQTHHGQPTVTRILMPLDGKRVASSVVDAEQFWLVTMEAGRVVRKDTLIAEGDEKKGCRRFVMSLGVSTVVAAGMQANVHQRYKASSITVFYGSGEKEDVLKRYIDNNLEPMHRHVSEGACCHEGAHGESKDGCCEAHHDEEACCE